MNLSKQVESLILQMSVFAKEHNHEFVTPEHLLYVMLSDKDFSAAFKNCGGNIEALKNDLENYFEKELTADGRRITEAQHHRWNSFVGC